VGKTSIEWTNLTWSPIRVRVKTDAAAIAHGKGYTSLIGIAGRMAGRVGPHCEHISPGCELCYAGTNNRRCLPSNGTGLPYDRRSRDLVEAFVDEKILIQPLAWKKPQRIFVENQSDLFGEWVTDEMIDRVFAVAGLTPWHTYQLLTKRPERMQRWANDKKTPFRVAKQIDCMEVSRAMADDGGEDIRPVPSYPGYFISNRGNIYSGNGSATCLYCGGKVEGIATKRYCTNKCKYNAGYLRRTGKKTEFEKSLQPMAVFSGEFGHTRVMLYRDGETFRELIHRLVLSVFDRPGTDKEMGCHRNGDAENCHIANLRWGMNEDNWEDRKRHGNGQSWSRITDEQVEEIRNRSASGETFIALGESFGVSATQISNIVHGRQHNIPAPLQWPLANCHLGVSAEDQDAANKRIPILLQTPAAVRFISAEPLLGPIDLNLLPRPFEFHRSPYGWMSWLAQRLHWAIVGGESGPGARPCDAEWIRGIVQQCKASGTAVFVKQLGGRPIGRISTCDQYPVRGHVWTDEGGGSHFVPHLKDKKGGAIDEFPADLRIREFPRVLQLNLTTGG
jgi:protein gp37